MSTHDLMVIGTSAGGVEALQVIARGLPGDLAAAVLIVMHTSPEGPYLLPDILSRAGPLEVARVVEGAPIERGKLYVAPPGHHLLVKDNCISLSRGPKENRSRPAIDPLFRTAAAAYGPRVVGVILTGMLDDGTGGLAAVKERGGIAIIQDPEDALYGSMPKSARRYVGGDFVLPISEIAPLLVRLVTEPAKTVEIGPISRLMEIESRFAEMETMSMNDMGRDRLSCGRFMPRVPRAHLEDQGRNVAALPLPRWPCLFRPEHGGGPELSYSKAIRAGQGFDKAT